MRNFKSDYAKMEYINFLDDRNEKSCGYFHTFVTLDRNSINKIRKWITIILSLIIYILIIFVTSKIIEFNFIVYNIYLISFYIYMRLFIKLFYKFYYREKYLIMLTLTNDYKLITSKVELCGDEYVFYDTEIFKIFLDFDFEVDFFNVNIYAPNNHMTKRVCISILNPFVKFNDTNVLVKRDCWDKEEIMKFLSKNERDIKNHRYSIPELREKYLKNR